MGIGAIEALKAAGQSRRSQDRLDGTRGGFSDS
jgi:hypothetical protein